MTWHTVLFIPIVVGISALAWFLGTAYFRRHATRLLTAAMVSARDRSHAHAKHLTEMAVRFDENLRQVDALHAFYATIQSNPAEAELDARISDLAAALARREQNFADRMWTNPTFVQFIAWLVVLTLVLRGCSLLFT